MKISTNIRVKISYGISDNHTYFCDGCFGADFDEENLCHYFDIEKNDGIFQNSLLEEAVLKVNGEDKRCMICCKACVRKIIKMWRKEKRNIINE